ncbi:hypothetical protein SERLADRAFT_364521 [Serpula lacrymans var. lacrymans S7.9]|uniref:DUF6589 domain-containing protein n=1 Tax=Serpula lacrymans var. lacrymans (strain S7.9) TaxID=578457 RepID=F8NEE6_SERL9|nr:uncharacterized protein SERLADRAFT_364521 [Serpula lacrymans var. lacrymans S7.9]EGO30580.1 hypothetical protein SERLADRAFT_364521 [Serpula lacrymans var. lacrymans S7.9]
MSHKWTANTYVELSSCAMQEVGAKIQWSPWIVSRDNVNIPMIKNQYISHVISVLLDSPGFLDYPHCNDKNLQSPPPVEELPCGPEQVVKQYILCTADIEEASYEGNDKVIAEWFHQLGIDSEAEKNTWTKQVIPWIGNQMTVNRLRGLFRHKHKDFNSFEHMDYMILVFGWLHLVKAFSILLHKQYLGTLAGYKKWRLKGLFGTILMRLYDI